MLDEKSGSRYGRQLYRLNKIRALVAILIVFTVAIILIYLFSQVRNGAGGERREISRVWNAGDYEQAYTISKNGLINKPVDYFLLTINGFSAYQLGISQINNYNTLFYINESITSLRKALHLREVSADARVSYVLGKAYYYKGSEYSDLAIKYLEIADRYYTAHDIPEYLGLAYAASGDYRSSVEAFTRSFNSERPPSDNLLLSIARSYIAMEEYNIAAGYLQRCIDTSPDSKSIIVAHFLSAEIHKVSGNYENAEKQYLTILSNYGENAEVHYQMGELYNLLGDTTRARAEWRLAFRQDPAHTRARARLNI